MFLDIIHIFIYWLIFIHYFEYQSVYLACEGNLFTSVFMNNIVVLFISRFFLLRLPWRSVRRLYLP